MSDKAAHLESPFEDPSLMNAGLAEPAALGPEKVAEADPETDKIIPNTQHDIIVDTEVISTKELHPHANFETASIDASSTWSGQGSTQAESVTDVTAPSDVSAVFSIDVDDWDSIYGGSDASSFTTSLSAGVTDYQWENGRRYHAYQAGRYPLPNDNVELDREDMKHHEFMLITEFQHYLSPIGSHPQRILDVGTGTGIWAVQVAEKHPSAEVTGIDLSPVQPSWVPPNCNFIVDDAEQEWLFPPNSYDLINVRFMFVAIKDFQTMFQRAYNTLAPGGYIEISELEINPTSQNPNGFPPNSHILAWIDGMHQASRKMGYDVFIGRKYKQMLLDAGFEDVTEKRFDVPWGPWPKDSRLKTIGYYHLGKVHFQPNAVLMVQNNLS
jgi:ubiquinone/menaquinone biosynthesis C-methylase UbiE